MITHHKIDGYENFQKILEILDGKGKVLFYFMGTLNPEGKNWCPDCNASEFCFRFTNLKIRTLIVGLFEGSPVIAKVLKEFEDKDFHFVQVGVGSREE